MIFHRANLEAVGAASRDPFMQGMNGVRFEPDGTTVASNGHMLVAVGPADPERARFPKHAAEPRSPGEDGIVMPIDTVATVLKQFVRDKRSELQYTCMSHTKDPARVGFTTINAKGDPTQHASLPKTQTSFVDWKNELTQISNEAKARICIDRKVLVDLLRVIERVAPPRGSLNPVYLEVSDTAILLRLETHETKQGVLASIHTYDTNGKWKQPTVWERAVLGVKEIVRRIKPVMKPRK